MDSINAVAISPISSNSVPLSQNNPILKFLIQQIDDLITKAQEALQTLTQKTDALIASVQGFLSSKSSIDVGELTKSSGEVDELQQKKVALKDAINDLLSLKDKLQRLSFSDFMKQCSDIENEVANQLRKISKLLGDI